MISKAAISKAAIFKTKISRAGYGSAGFLLLAAATAMGGSTARAQPASLQDVPLQAPPKISPWPESPPDSSAPEATDQPQEATESPAAESQTPESQATDNKTTATTEDADIASLDIDWSLLDVDASTLMTTSPVKLHLVSRAAPSNNATWSSQEKAYGSAVSVKQPISPFLDTRVGADLTVVRQPATLSELLAEKATNGGNEPQSSGTAWAAVTAPGVTSIWDKTAVEARIDPAQDQGKFGTTLSKSLTLSERYSLTIQNGYNLTQGLAPIPGSASRATYATEQSAKLGITDTGTSLSAGQTLSTTDDKWLRKIGAEQKLFDGVSVSATVGETPQGVTNKSLTAGFKHSW